jgi:hypothetical protein
VKSRDFSLIGADRNRLELFNSFESILRLFARFVFVALAIACGFSSTAKAQVLGDIPSGGGAGGKFGGVTSWPLVPLHMVLLPDGRVLSYGTDQNGAQGGGLVYDIWDPKISTGTDPKASHRTLPNRTSTDIFCNTGTLIAEGRSGKNRLTGMFLGLGGDDTVKGVRNYSNKDVVVLNPATNQLASAGTMRFKRWYATLATLPTGEKLLLGGRRTPSEYYQTLGPLSELFNPTRGWRTLSGVAIDSSSIQTTQLRSEWYYPKVGIGKNSVPYLFSQAGIVYRLSVAGSGSATDSGATRMDESSYIYPMAQLPNPKADPNSPSYDPNASNFLYLSLRNGRKASMIDLATDPPSVASVPDLAKTRIWGNLTVLADGKLFASGGSASDDVVGMSSPDQVQEPAFQSEIYDPSTGATGTWRSGASAKQIRVYHSAALLLTDGSVLTGGGGAPGPVNNRDVEIYYPPYLYDDVGAPKPRPRIVTAPKTVRHGQAFDMTVATGDAIKRMSLVQLGFVTHSYNPDQHYSYVQFKQTGTNVRATPTSDPSILPPGYYMLFVFNQNDTPSIATIVSVPQLVN